LRKLTKLTHTLDGREVMANRCLVDSNDYRRITRLTWTITPFGREQLPKFFQRFNLDDDCQLTDLLYGWTCRTAFTVQLQRWTVDDLTGSTLARLPGTTRHIHCDTITRFSLTHFTVTRLPDSAFQQRLRCERLETTTAMGFEVRAIDDDGNDNN